MKILYSIQGTGNGHVSRAREIIPFLKKYGDLDILISGTQAEVALDDEVKYRFKGLGFIFGEKGGFDFWKTWKSFDSRQFIKDCRNLPVEKYDLVINDFEPITAWSCKLKKVKSVSLSHQSAFYSKKTPQLKGFHWGKVIMKNYAPASSKVAFHFQKYDDFIQTPVIRSEIRNLKPENRGYYTVYLPAYSDEFILNLIKIFPETRWQIFSKHSSEYYEKYNAEIFPIDNEKFRKSLQNCCGFLTGGGFEGPAEALFLKKKLLSVPMYNQYEQLCNALALEEMGIPVVWKESQFPEKLGKWIVSENNIEINFPDETEKIIETIFKTQFPEM